MLPTDLFIAAVHGYNLPNYVFVLPSSTVFLVINKAQSASSYEECVIDINSHAYFNAISAFRVEIGKDSDCYCAYLSQFAHDILKERFKSKFP